MKEIWLAGGLALAVLAAPPPAGAQPAAVPGELLVRLPAPLDAGARGRLEAATGGRVLGAVPRLGIVRLGLPAGGGTAAAVRSLRALPEVAAVEPNAIGRGGFLPDDPQFPLQWQLDNTGQTGGTPDSDIDAPEGWAITRGSADVVVAVLDTGVDFAHPELAGRLLPGYDFVNGDGDPTADHPHGIAVTGLLAANADDGIGVAGVDHRARILPVKVLDVDNTGMLFHLIAGLDYAAAQGADVISMSLIDYPSNSSMLEAALQGARDAGAVLVACAGNHGLGDADVSGPGAYPETISVGWTDQDDLRGTAGTDSSATGAALDLVAPGELVVTVTSSAPQFFSGCSAATPIVAGIVSLLLSLDPALGHDPVKAVLEASAVDGVGPPGEDAPGRDDFYGFGRANLAAALALAPEPERGGAAAALLALAGLRRRRW